MELLGPSECPWGWDWESRGLSLPGQQSLPWWVPCLSFCHGHRKSRGSGFTMGKHETAHWGSGGKPDRESLGGTQGPRPWASAVLLLSPHLTGPLIRSSFTWNWCQQISSTCYQKVPAVISSNSCHCCLNMWLLHFTFLLWEMRGVCVCVFQLKSSSIRIIKFFPLSWKWVFKSEKFLRTLQ